MNKVHGYLMDFLWFDLSCDGADANQIDIEQCLLIFLCHHLVMEWMHVDNTKNVFVNVKDNVCR